jgi:hypothetical protein
VQVHDRHFAVVGVFDESVAVYFSTSTSMGGILAASFVRTQVEDFAVRGGTAFVRNSSSAQPHFTTALFEDGTSSSSRLSFRDGQFGSF